MLAGEFCVANREFSDPWCLVNTLYTEIVVSFSSMSYQEVEVTRNKVHIYF